MESIILDTPVISQTYRYCQKAKHIGIHRISFPIPCHMYHIFLDSYMYFNFLKCVCLFVYAYIYYAFLSIIN